MIVPKSVVRPMNSSKNKLNSKISWKKNKLAKQTLIIMYIYVVIIIGKGELATGPQKNKYCYNVDLYYY